MQRNTAILLTVFVVMCILLLLLLVWAWWVLLAPAAPAPTPTEVSLFVTPTEVEASTPVEGEAVTETPTLIVMTSTPSATPVPTATPTATPVPSDTPTPFIPTSTPRTTPTPSTPYAIMNSPHGFVNVRSGPGVVYDPPLGTYQNTVVADVLGKQYDLDGNLWWLISFPAAPFDQGWVYAPYTLAYNVGQIPWVTAPPTPTPVYVSPTPTPRPHAVINSPDGFLNARSGPGQVYPTLGRYYNGATVNVIGKQAASNGALWWLVPFAGSVNGQGWIYADFTIARNTAGVPWISAPPTPTLVPRTPTPTPTPTGPPLVNWTITGRVVDAITWQPVDRASVRARLGNNGPTLSTLTDSNGNFSLVGQAGNEGNLVMTVNAFGYEEKEFTAGAVKPRVYDFPNIGLVPQQAPVVSWVVTGRAVEIGTGQPVAGAQVEAVLGDDNVNVSGVTGPDGTFSLEGQARDSGTLNLSIVADGYQFFTYTSPQTDSRVYNLDNLSLVPVAGSCAYESVIDLSQASALARLQTLNFTRVSTTPVTVQDGSGLVDRVINQTPDPPPEGGSRRLNCQTFISLGIGVLATE